jgi:hypothetical protein
MYLKICQLLALLIFANIIYSQGLFGPPKKYILQNTYSMITNTSRGTCFVVKDDGIEYIITAKHLFNNKHKNNDIVLFSLNKDNIKEPFTASIHFHENTSIDVVVLKSKSKLTLSDTLYSNGGTMELGGDAYFLGFPYEGIGSKSKWGKMPFIKKAVISAMNFEKGIEIIYLDGHNNPGFSGGPVLSYDPKLLLYSIIGVISGYRPQTDSAKLTLDGKTIPFKYHENSGIIISYSARHYIEIIDRIRKMGT